MRGNVRRELFLYKDWFYPHTGRGLHGGHQGLVVREVLSQCRNFTLQFLVLKASVLDLLTLNDETGHSCDRDRGGKDQDSDRLNVQLTLLLIRALPPAPVP